MGTAAALEPAPTRGTWYRWRQSLSANTVTAGGTVLVLLVIIFALVGPLILPYDSNTVNTVERLQSPSLHHPLGTDQYGRDILSRTASGARVSLLVGFGGTVVALAFGMLLGAVGAYVGGWLDDIIMRVMDVLMAFPYIVLGIALAWVIGPSLSTLIIVIGIIRIPQMARITRGSVLEIREREYVEAANALGQRPLVTLARHVIPNAISPVIVYATLAVATAINAEAALSFLGLGIQPPMASWGNMLSDGRDYLLDAPWIATFPGLFISVTILALNLLGDGLRDALDPTMRGRDE